MNDRAQGPNVKRLAIQFTATAMSRGGIAETLNRIKDAPLYLRAGIADAYRAIDLVKTCPDNPYGEDDETIARAILEKVEAKRASGVRSSRSSRTY